MTFEDWRDACADAWAAEGLDPRTIHGYEVVLGRVDAWCADRGLEIETLTPSEIVALAAEWPFTRSSRMALRCSLGRLWDVLEIAPQPRGAIKVPSKPRYACRALDEPDAAVLARVAEADGSPKGLAVMIGLYAGLRSSETAKLRWEDFDLRDRWLRIVGKKSVTGEIPVHPRLASRLESVSSETGWLFPGRGRPHVHPVTILNWSRTLSAQALGWAVPPHRLRHTAIATVNDLTGDLRAAQMFARHASPETTVLYTRVSRRRLEAAVGALHYGDATSA